MSIPISDAEFAILQYELYASFKKLAHKAGPERFQTFICAALSNLAGNIDEDYWARFRVTSPCEKPGCNCHILAEKVMVALEELRTDHHRTHNKCPPTTTTPPPVN